MPMLTLCHDNRSWPRMLRLRPLLKPGVPSRNMLRAPNLHETPRSGFAEVPECLAFEQHDRR